MISNNSLHLVNYSIQDEIARAFADWVEDCQAKFREALPRELYIRTVQLANNGLKDEALSRIFLVLKKQRALRNLSISTNEFGP